MNTPNVNETQMPASPPPRQRVQRCPCCGDYRLSVIVVDAIIMFMNALALIIISVGDDGENALQSYGFAGNWILSVVSLVMAPISILGAVIANTYLVLANAMWLPIGYIAGIAIVARYCQDYYGRSYCDGGQLAWILANKLVVGAIMILFIWPHVGFAAKLNGGALCERLKNGCGSAGVVTPAESMRGSASGDGGNDGNVIQSEDERHIDVDATSANDPPSGSPIPLHAQRCCGCAGCCDYRSFVIIVDVIIMVTKAILLIGIAVDGTDFLAQYGVIPAGGAQYGADPEYFYGLVRPQVILGVVSLAMAAVSVLGAVMFNAYLVLANALWLPIEYITGIALVASYCKEGGCYWTDTYSIVLNRLVFGVVMIFFLWPHVGFIAKVNSGVLTSDTYAEGENRCNCCARAGNNSRVREEPQPAAPREEPTTGINDGGSEIDVEAPESQSSQNKANVAWGRKHALKIIAVVAAMFLIIGLSVGLTQNSRESKEVACGVPRYHPDPQTTCEALMAQDEHTNSYWMNENFLCRTNERPCEATSSKLVMGLPNGMSIAFDTRANDFGPAEVWHVTYASCSAAWCWRAGEAYGYDHNSYRFGSLECRSPNPGVVDLIVIDGVLVDSCPESAAEMCRVCGSSTGSECVARKWQYSSKIAGSWVNPLAGCTNTNSGNEQLFASLQDCCLYHFGSAICRSHDTCTGLWYDNENDYELAEPPTEDESDDSVECERSACEVPAYQPNPTTNCRALLSQDDHTNSYWPNDNFLCRTNERPCLATSPDLYLDLGSDMSIKISVDTNKIGEDFGQPDVWHLRTDRYGNMKTTPWSSPYRFFSEGRWFDDPPPGGFFQDFLFGSLECMGPQADDEFVFIVIDGVLVDSCPKSVAEECRVCNSREC